MMSPDNNNLQNEFNKAFKIAVKMREAEEKQNPFYFVAYRDWETDRKSTRLNSSHSGESRMPSSA